jgi:hypothetical protein
VDLALKDVVNLRAECPACGHSFRALGVSMRRHANAMTRYFVVTEVVWIHEGRHAIAVEPSEVERVRTPRDLVVLLRAKSSDRASAAEILTDLSSRIRRPLDASHLDTPLEDLVPGPGSMPA